MVNRRGASIYAYDGVARGFGDETGTPGQGNKDCDDKSNGKGDWSDWREACGRSNRRALLGRRRRIVRVRALCRAPAAPAEATLAEQAANVPAGAVWLGEPPGV